MGKKEMIKAGAIAGVAVIGVGISTMLAPSLVRADDSSSIKDDIYAKVIEKLGLNVTATQLGDALSEARYEVRNEHFNTQLEEAVAEGSITQEQADLALEVHAAMETYREENKPNPEDFEGMTPDERHEAMKAHREEMRSEIASQVGISVEELDALHEALKDAGVMPGMHKGPGMGL